MARWEIRAKNRWTLVGGEMILLSILLSVWLAKKWSWDTFTAIIAGIVILIVTSFLFFRIRIFRYIFSILFSLAWGLLGYTFADSASASSVTPWVTALLVIALSLFWHKDYFRFESG
ncbi:MAG: hypothetical protein KF746_07840 [Chitinophagaceae bacterium]|nr:hypothetical protein [Chitinophagaceae bacterium]